MKSCISDYRNEIINHPFVDGNKRIGHAAVEVMLLINGFEIKATVDMQKKVILAFASGTMNKTEFNLWLKKHVGTISFGEVLKNDL